MAEEEKTPDRKGTETSDVEAGNREFDQFRFTPYTSDEAFYNDPVILNAGRNARAALESHAQPGAHSGRPDQDLKDEIHRLLRWLEQVDTSGIQVEVEQGIVTLSGQVRAAQDLQKVEKMAANVIGVLEVRNQLSVGQSDR